MTKIRIWTTLSCCLILGAAAVQAQKKPVPGLWEVTTTMRVGGPGAPQMPQMPPNVKLPPGMQRPASPNAPHTTQVCMTQAFIDKYGGAFSTPPRGDCEMTDISITSGGMTAKIVCTGEMNATGTVKATFVDAKTTKTTIHMTGTSRVGRNSEPVDVTMDLTSVYKGPDCGNVKPAAPGS